MIVWAQGEFRDAGDVRIGLADRGFLLGDGVFDTFRVAGGAARRLDAHLARLRAAAQTFGLVLPFSDGEAAAAVRELSARNALPDAAARLTVSRGEGPRGPVPPDPAAPFAVLTLSPRPAPPRSVDVVLSDVVRPADALTSRHKTLSYIENVEARRRAAAAGFGEALMLNERGELACATTGNLFWLSGGALHTPALDCGVLAGITRARVLEIAAARGMRAHEGRYGPDALAGAEAAFLTNSVAGVVAVHALDGPGGRTAFDPENGLVSETRQAEAAD